MDRLSAMALLVKVAELGSMSAAARALNMPLTTVSRQIGELENTLGVRLMIRTTRKLTLTDAGVDYVAAARRILEEVENAERQAAGEYQEPKGELVLSAPTMFGRQHVLPVVTDFLARYRSFVLNRQCLIAAGALTPKRRRTGWWRCSRSCR